MIVEKFYWVFRIVNDYFCGKFIICMIYIYCNEFFIRIIIYSFESLVGFFNNYKFINFK